MVSGARCRLRRAAVVPAYAGTQEASPSPQPSPIKGEGVGPSSRVAPGVRASTLICHCEEHSDVAISMRLNTRRRTAVATATGLATLAPQGLVTPHPIPLPSRERGWVTVVVTRSRSTRIRLDLPLRRNAVATATGLPRYARNDKVGTHELFRSCGVGCGVQPWFRLAPVAGEVY